MSPPPSLKYVSTLVYVTLVHTVQRFCPFRCQQRFQSMVHLKNSHISISSIIANLLFSLTWKNFTWAPDVIGNELVTTILSMSRLSCHVVACDRSVGFVICSLRADSEIVQQSQGYTTCLIASVFQKVPFR